MANATVIQVQVRIERDTKYGTLCDALYFPVNTFFKANGTRNITDAQIKTAADKRVAAYEAKIEAARLLPPAPPATEQELFGWMSDADIAKFEEWKSSRLAKDV